MAAAAEPILEPDARVELVAPHDWSEHEVAHVTRALRQIEATPVRWEVGDYLLRALPLSHARTGTQARLRDLAARTGRSWVFLQALRTTAARWPPEHRPAPEVAPWHTCRIFVNGGAQTAAWRLRQLEALAEQNGGRVIVEALRRWRNAGNVAPAKCGTRRVSRITVNPWLVFLLAVGHEVERRQGKPVADAELGALYRDVSALLDRTDILMCRKAPDHTSAVRDHVDALAGDLERIGTALDESR